MIFERSIEDEDIVRPIKMVSESDGGRMEFQTMETHLISMNNLADGSQLDDDCLSKLCTIFNKNQLWKKLAEELNFTAFISVWEDSSNPAKMVFKFSEVYYVKLLFLFLRQ